MWFFLLHIDDLGVWCLLSKQSLSYYFIFIFQNKVHAFIVYAQFISDFLKGVHKKWGDITVLVFQKARHLYQYYLVYRTLLDCFEKRLLNFTRFFNVFEFTHGLCFIYFFFLSVCYVVSKQFNYFFNIFKYQVEAISINCFLFHNFSRYIHIFYPLNFNTIVSCCQKKSFWLRSHWNTAVFLNVDILTWSSSYLKSMYLILFIFILLFFRVFLKQALYLSSIFVLK